MAGSWPQRFLLPSAAHTERLKLPPHDFHLSGLSGLKKSYLKCLIYRATLETGCLIEFSFWGRDDKQKPFPKQIRVYKPLRMAQPFSTPRCRPRGSSSLAQAGSCPWASQSHHSQVLRENDPYTCYNKNPGIGNLTQPESENKSR